MIKFCNTISEKRCFFNYLTRIFVTSKTFVIFLHIAILKVLLFNYASSMIAAVPCCKILKPEKKHFSYCITTSTQRTIASTTKVSMKLQTAGLPVIISCNFNKNFET